MGGNLRLSLIGPTVIDSSPKMISNKVADTPSGSPLNCSKKFHYSISAFFIGNEHVIKRFFHLIACFLGKDQDANQESTGRARIQRESSRGCVSESDLFLDAFVPLLQPQSTRPSIFIFCRIKGSARRWRKHPMGPNWERWVPCVYPS